MKRKVISLILCIALVLSILPATALAARDISYEETLAQQLKTLGLFRGVSDTEFELDRAPTRVEALIMLIRVLGVEDDALGGTWTHPFTDVPAWADLYVGYAYENGLTNGVSATEFGSEDATAAMFVTFALRALGYSDSGSSPDFVWSNPFTLAELIGILPETVDRTNFRRADVVLVSHAALGATLKDSDTTLASKLIGAGVFTDAQYAALTGGSTPSVPAVSADEIAAQHTDAIFRLDMYHFNGEFIGSATGVFVSPDGYALTSFYVAANCYLYATTSDGSVSDAYTATVDCDDEGDLVLLKVDVGNVTVPCIEVGDASALAAGETVYAVSAAGVPEAGHTVTANTVADPALEAFQTTYVKPSADIDGDGTVVLGGDGELVGISVYYYGENDELVNYISPSSRLESIDLTSTDDTLYYLNSYLSGMGILDFGSITGVDLVESVETPLGYKLQYDLTDFHDMHDGYAAEHFDLSIAYYMLALEMEGFETVETGIGDTYMMMTSEEAVLIIVDYSDDSHGIYITAEVIPVCYDDVPGLPDFLWYFADGKSGSESYVSEQDPELLYRSYTLDGYTAEEQAQFLTDYAALLENYDFTPQENTNNDGVLYYTKDDLFVAIFVEENNFFIYISYFTE